MSLVVTAPVPGTALAMADVPDPVFAQSIVGPGLAVEPPAGTVQALAPVDGTVLKLHPHAFVVLAGGGRGVLVHLGIDTVQMAGEGFELLVAEGDAVVAGQPVLRFDADAVRASGRSAVVPVVALDVPVGALTDLRAPGPVAAGEPLFTLP
ncbi:PTS sugar transporter subunit IIA [Kineococcus indalonis]|uniref:PTS sugar transporter subunit IIA n=1 Tax=Kineococcus indalonis TaxID=2696566 RepID=UPI001412734C|nr:PTS glucose transporter subunit IIA [Kineococcus indalonis]NAZ86398.1 PTS glucose transporter subunit IIA [Kineococcus indalonis]